MLALVADQQPLPLRAQLRPARADPGGEASRHRVGDQELGVLRPAVEALRLAHLLLAERLAVGGGRVLLVRRAVADVAVDDDQRRPVVGRPEGLERPSDLPEVVGVADPGDVPAVGHEPPGDVVVIGDLGAPVDRDVVVVVDPAEVVEPLVARERRRLVRDALHQAAVAGDHVGVEVEQLVAGAVEVRRLPLRGDRHPDRRRHPLAERPGGRLDPGGPAVLRVAGRLRVELAERLDVVERDRLAPLDLVVGVDGPDPGEVKQRVEQHRGVAGGEHEAVAVGPDRLVGVEAQEPLPEDVGDRGERHRRPRVARVRLLDRVDRQRADRVHGELVDLVEVLLVAGHRTQPNEAAWRCQCSRSD